MVFLMENPLLLAALFAVLALQKLFLQLPGAPLGDRALKGAESVGVFLSFGRWGACCGWVFGDGVLPFVKSFSTEGTEGKVNDLVWFPRNSGIPGIPLPLPDPFPGISEFLAEFLAPQFCVFR